MTFHERSVSFQRKPSYVEALRIDGAGNIPIWHTEDGWVKRAIAERRLTRGEQHWYIKNSDVHTAVAYPGSWIVLDKAKDQLFVLEDADFRAAFEDRAWADGEQDA